MQFSALISDLDGTLLDTLRDMADAVNLALGRLRFPPHEVSAYRHCVGDGRRMMALRSLPTEHRNEGVLEPLLNYIAEEYEQRWMKHSTPFPGIPEMLDELSRRSIRLAVLSNKPQVYVGPMISTILGRWKFEHVFGESPDLPRKPDPAGALLIAQRMGLNPKQCIYMGDSGVDMETAVAAGMFGVGALWGFRDEPELRAGGANLLATHPRDVIAFLDSQSVTA
ncbi:MAG: HAD family hydrolase [Dehalococcoidia bacterium]|nr:HAD family hydrolase [Dehalococcoidia bacterium]